MKAEIRNLMQPENRRYIPLMVVGLGVAAIQLAVRELIRPYEEMRAERLQQEEMSQLDTTLLEEEK